MQDPVAVALERGPQRVLGLGAGPAAGRRRAGGRRRQLLLGALPGRPVGQPERPARLRVTARARSRAARRTGVARPRRDARPVAAPAGPSRSAPPARRRARPTRRPRRWRRGCPGRRRAARAGRASTGAGGRAGGSATARRQVASRSSAALEQVRRPGPVGAVVPGQQRQPDRHRVDAVAAQPGDEDQVAAALAHLLAVQADHRRVHVGPGERLGGGERLGVHGGVLVVREDQVAAAALHVEAHADGVQRDRGALDVPARAAGDAPRAGPRGLARALAAPQHRVQRLALARPVGVAAALGEEAAASSPRRSRTRRRSRGPATTSW